MISPSEALLGGESLATRTVLPLEFHALDELVADRAADTVAEVTSIENQSRDADEVAELRQRITRQSVEMEERIEVARRRRRVKCARLWPAISKKGWRRSGTW